VRLLFSGALGAGAFTSVSYYAVSSDIGPSPTNVTQAFAIGGTPNGVELAIDEDLAIGAIYTLTVTAVPFADTSTCTGAIYGSTAQPTTTPADAEPATSDVDLLIFGRDLLHDGNDFVEDTTGDLATIEGPPNWKGAIGRRMASYGIKWDRRYSPRADLYVNAPDAYKLPLAGTMVAQAQADDRTKTANISVAQAADPNSYTFSMKIFGKDGIATYTVDLPIPR
jgi:hypothetical protein